MIGAGYAAFYVAFETPPNSDSPTWVNLTSRVRRFEYTRGKQRALAKHEAGTATILLDNRDRALDPFNASSPYAPNVIPQRKCQIRGAVSASAGDTLTTEGGDTLITEGSDTLVTEADADEVVLWTGYIDRWPPVWDEGDAVVEVSATGPFKVLARMDTPSSVWAIEAAAATPDLWARFSEDAGTVATDSSGNRRDGVYDGGALFNSRTSLIYGDPSSAVEFESGMKARFPAPSVTAYPISVSTWFSVGEPTSANQRLLVMGMQSPVGSSPQVDLYVHGNVFNIGKISFAVLGAAGLGYREVGTTARFDDGRPHFVTAVAHSSTNLEIMVDGVLQPTTTLAAGFPSFPESLTEWTMGNSGWTDLPMLGVLDEAMVFARAVTLTEHQNLYAAGRYPWNEDLPGERIERILDAVGWPVSARSIDTGSSPLGPAKLGGKVLPHLQRVAASDHGALIETRDGKIRFRGRQAIYSPPFTTVQATLTDGRTAGITYDRSKPVVRYDEVVNIARLGSPSVGRVEGYEDVDSQETYWPQIHEDTDLLNGDAEDLRHMAQYIVHRFSSPAMEFDTVELDSSGGTDQIQQMIDRDLEDLVVVEKSPPGGGGAISVRAHIQGMRLVVDSTGDEPNHWHATWWLSSVDATQTTESPYMMLDTGLLDGARVGY